MLDQDRYMKKAGSLALPRSYLRIRLLQSRVVSNDERASDTLAAENEQHSKTVKNPRMDMESVYFTAN